MAKSPRYLLEVHAYVYPSMRMRAVAIYEAKLNNLDNRLPYIRNGIGPSQGFQLMVHHCLPGLINFHLITWPKSYIGHPKSRSTREVGASSSIEDALRQSSHDHCFELLVRNFWTCSTAQNHFTPRIYSYMYYHVTIVHLFEWQN